MVNKAAHHKVFIYDTTLRDGAQGEGISFSVEDKLALLKRLDAAGIHYVEGGWPHPSNLKDTEFFRRASRLKLKHARLAAFGSTRKAGVSAGKDINLKGLLDAKTPVVAIVGKAWDMHAREILGVSLAENLAMVRESVAFLKARGREVVFDAEHFFDGWKTNREYTLEVLKTAESAGADWLVLCDTNGGTLPEEIRVIVGSLKGRFRAPLAIHAHNDCECAVANSLVAVAAGATQVHGTLNGYGERTGNANLCSIIPALKVKMGVDCVTDAQLKGLRALSMFAFETATRSPRDEMPFVGSSAFAHKAGLHVHAVEKNPRAVEHMDPGLVGNRRHVVISDQSGLAAVRWKAEGFGFKLPKGSARGRLVLAELKRKEEAGYNYEGAEASFELLVRRILAKTSPYFRLLDYRVSVEHRGGEMVSEAALKVAVDGTDEHTVAVGDGPVNALDAALRKALARFYPAVKLMHLVDYRVRVINPAAATAAKVRVAIESTDGRETWSTVGVSENIIDASWQALADSVEYCLKSNGVKPRGSRGA
jgi:2-isopropylmalate synthase